MNSSSRLATLAVSLAGFFLLAAAPSLAQSTASDRTSESPTVHTNGTKPQAAAAPKRTAKSSEAHEEQDDDLTTEKWRAKSWSSVMLTFAPGIILLDKAGIEADLIPTRYFSLGIEALTAEQNLGYKAISFGSFRETIWTVNARLYPFTNSFHLLAGYGQRFYTLDLGSSADSILMNGWGASLGEDAKLEVQNEIVEFGIGNRWQHQKIVTIGIDWFTLYIPTGAGRERAPLLNLVSSEKNKERFRSITKSLRRMTTFSIFKLQVGFSF